MNNSRPVNLNLAAFTWPVTAIASILHRVCAVIVWVGLGFLIVVGAPAINSPEEFLKLANLLETNFLAQFVAWGLLTATSYYCAGTVKHLIQDFGFCEDFAGGKMISWAAIVVGIVLSLLAGALVWL